jgi:hypothetical protein
MEIAVFVTKIALIVGAFYVATMVVLKFAEHKRSKR